MASSATGSRWPLAVSSGSEPAWILTLNRCFVLQLPKLLILILSRRVPLTRSLLIVPVSLIFPLYPGLDASFIHPLAKPASSRIATCGFLTV